MGEVYRAKDTKLGREVAIKVLPEGFSDEPERMARFEREAKLLASLNHANIATLHGYEADGERQFLVMEVVEGETLADRVAGGPLSLDEALPIFLQVANGLEAAHESGVIHRDLKPANVKADEDGNIKILDFGLAKAMTPEPASADPALSQSPTLTLAATQRGEILGTAAYMSPEQARGRAIDKRTDVWAFGVCLWEALVGKRLFEGEDAMDTVGAVLRDAPSFDDLPPAVPPRLRELLRRCLRKDAKQRLRDIGEARIEIEHLIAAPEVADERAAAVVESDKRSPLPVVLVATVATVVAGLAAWFLKPAPPTPPAPTAQIVRFPVALPEGHTFTRSGRRVLAISPDGSRIAYTADSRLYLRALDQLVTQEVPGVEDPAAPMFSPDGEWLAFAVDGQLRKVAVSGGAPVTLCDMQLPSGARWEKDGTILFGQAAEGIYRVADTGGTPELLVDGQEELGRFVAGQLLPGGEAVIFSLETPETGGAAVFAQILDTGERVELVQGAVGRFVATSEPGLSSSLGHLLFVRDGVLLAVAFDAAQLTVLGGPVPILEDVRAAQGGDWQFDLADNGTLLYTSADAGFATNSLVLVNRQGRQEPLAAENRAHSGPRVSPDGNRLAFSATESRSGGSDLWVFDLERRTPTRITFDEADDQFPVWAPDGQSLVFSSFRTPQGLYRKAADGTGDAQPIGREAVFRAATDWTPDGRHLMVNEPSGAGGIKLGVETVDGDAAVRWMVDTEFISVLPAVSPDGRFVAYMSTESGRPEIYVIPFAEEEAGKWQISNAGGFYPAWSIDGGELFFWGLNRTSMMAVSVETEPAFRAGNPESLFEARSGEYLSGFSREYDVMHDGRFVMVKLQETTAEGGEQAGEELIVVQNWVEELRARVPLQP